MSGESQKWTGHGLVLLAEDDESVRLVTSRALRLFGFEVLQAADGQAAVDIYRDHAAVIVCVLLDLTMPRLDGIAALDAIRAVRADAPVVLISGYSEQEARSRFRGHAPSACLEKPFDLATLRETLRQVLEPGAGASEEAC